MNGFRKDNPDGKIPEVGQYGKDQNGDWFGCPQEEFHANLSKHDVIEHQSGRITVSPSILITSHLGQWHGYLRDGEWSKF